MLQRTFETIRPVWDDLSEHERRNPSEIGIAKDEALTCVPTWCPFRLQFYFNGHFGWLQS
jgi:hypothetical protein